MSVSGIRREKTRPIKFTSTQLWKTQTKRKKEQKKEKVKQNRKIKIHRPDPLAYERGAQKFVQSFGFSGQLLSGKHRNRIKNKTKTKTKTNKKQKQKTKTKTKQKKPKKRNDLMTEKKK